MSGVIAYLGLGSNLGDPIAHVTEAVAELAAHPEVTHSRCSPLYQSAPVGPEGQQDYINAVLEIETTLESIALLDWCQEIENRHGRERHERWGSRTLDVDVLLYGYQVIQHERLIVPHAEMHWRAFVLRPLADLNADIALPGFGLVSELLSEISEAGQHRLN